MVDHRRIRQADAAIAKCKAIVDEDLAQMREPGKTADLLDQAYTAFGDDPFVVAPRNSKMVTFSAWDYAEERCAVVCNAIPAKLN